MTAPGFQGGFRGKGNIIVQGDLLSANWDGSIPETTFPATATEGYYLDSSSGNAQFSGTVTIGEKGASAGDQNYLHIDPEAIGLGTAVRQDYTAGGVFVGRLQFEYVDLGATDRAQISLTTASSGTDEERIIISSGYVLIEGGPNGPVELIASGIGFDDDIILTGKELTVNAGSMLMELGTDGTTSRQKYLLKDINSGFEIAHYAASNGSTIVASMTFDLESDLGGFFTTNGTFSVDHAETHLNPLNGDNVVVLALDIERAWEFRQRATGGSTDLDFYSTSNKQLYIGGDTNGDILIVDSNGGNIWLPAHTTTAAAANANIRSTDGIVRRSTSSAKYKRQIADWKPREKDWQAIRPVSFESNIKGEKGQKHKGFVYEELPSVFQADNMEDLRAIVAALVSRVKDLEKVVA